MAGIMPACSNFAGNGFEGVKLYTTEKRFISVSQMVGDYGVTGAAMSSILTAAIVLSVVFFGLWKKLHFSIADLKSGYDFAWFKRWSRVGAFSALDSLIRNAVYLIVVIRAMNMLEEQGGNSIPRHKNHPGLKIDQKSGLEK